MTQDLSPKEIQQLVEERALAIAKAAELPDVKAEEKLDPWFVIDRLRRNRVGDADLFVTLFRGRYAYVPEWDKWLYWSGHHWDIDLLSRRALADVEQVCAAYQDAIGSTNSARLPVEKRCLSARRLSTIRRLLRPTILISSTTIWRLPPASWTCVPANAVPENLISTCSTPSPQNGLGLILPVPISSTICSRA